MFPRPHFRADDREQRLAHLGFNQPSPIVPMGPFEPGPDAELNAAGSTPEKVEPPINSAPNANEAAENAKTTAETDVQFVAHPELVLGNMKDSAIVISQSVGQFGETLRKAGGGVANALWKNPQGGGQEKKLDLGTAEKPTKEPETSVEKPAEAAGEKVDAPEVKAALKGAEQAVDAPKTNGEKLTGNVNDAAQNLLKATSIGDFIRAMKDLVTAIGKLLNATPEQMDAQFVSTESDKRNPKTNQEKGAAKISEAKESNEVQESAYEKEKGLQLNKREDDKYASAGTDWSTLDTGIADQKGEAYIYKKIDGAERKPQILVAQGAEGNMQYLDNDTKQWSSLDPTNEAHKAILDANPVNYTEVRAAERTQANTGNNAERAQYDNRLIQNSKNGDMERKCLKDPKGDAEWFKENEEAKMWEQENEPVRDALRTALEQDAKAKEAQPEDETKAPKEEEGATKNKDEASKDKNEQDRGGPKEGEEDKEKPSESPDARAKRILEETQKMLDNQEAEGTPEVPARIVSKKTDEAPEEVEQVKEQNETEANRKNRLWDEVRGKEPFKKVDALKKEKEADIKQLETGRDEAVEQLTSMASGQEATVKALKNKLENAKGMDQEVTGPLQEQLTQEQEKLNITEKNIQTIKDNADKRIRSLNDDMKMLDTMEADVKKAAKRAKKRLEKIGADLSSNDELDLGRLAKVVIVQDDGSLGFSVVVPGELVTRLDAVMGEEQEKDLTGDNPTVVLGILDATLTSKVEAAKNRTA